MNIRPAELSDRPAVRDVARRSLQASYSLGPNAITGAVEEWYDEATLRETVADDNWVLLVAEMDGQVVAFSESVLSSDDVGTLLWLHVDPARRGGGVASTLFDETRERLHDLGTDTIRGRVLTDNVEGTAFYEDRGFEKVGTDQVEIDGETYVENIYTEAGEEGREPTTDDGRTVYIDHDALEPGSMAPFYVVFCDRDSDERYGYFCSRCDNLANGMDAMGRIECDACGNTRKPVRWDSAYL